MAGKHRTLTAFAVVAVTSGLLTWGSVTPAAAVPSATCAPTIAVGVGDDSAVVGQILDDSVAAANAASCPEGATITLAVTDDTATFAIPTHLEWTSDDSLAIVTDDTRSATIVPQVLDDTRILSVEPAGTAPPTVSLSNLILTRGHANGPGGAVYLDDTALPSALSLTDMTFTANSAQVRGGAVHTFGALTVTNSTFTGNLVDGQVGASSGAYGGAIYGAGAMITIVGSTFSGNVANGDPGGILRDAAGGAVAGGSMTLIQVASSEFTDNRADTGGGQDAYGGAISSGTAGLTITSGIFRRNGVSAVGDVAAGGAVKSAGPTTILGSEFTDDSVVSSGGSRGGALAIDGGTSTVANSTFTGNEAHDDSYALGGAIVTTTDLTIGPDVSFVSNRSVGGVIAYGGGIVSANAALTMAGADFTSNESVGAASSIGGAVTSLGDGVATVLSVSGSSFTANTATTQGEGGAIAVLGADTALSVTQSTFDSNVSPTTGIGGAIASSATSDDVISANYFTANSAGAGGAIYLQDDSDVGNSSSASVTNNTFYGNESVNEGRALVSARTTSDDTVIQVIANTFDDSTTDDSSVVQALNGAVKLAGNILVKPGTTASTCLAASGGSIVDLGGNVTTGACGSISINTTEAALDLSAPALNTTGPSNSGPTKTQALGAGSSALDVFSSYCPSVDQRGVARPQGSACDAGAYERYVAPPPPVYPPTAPRDVRAVAGDKSAQVTWTAPASSGSFAISSYQVRSNPASDGCVTSALTCDVTGLVNGTDYTFEVRALNGAGWGPWSAASDAVTPEPAVVQTIVITGSRGDVRGQPGVIVKGSTTGFGMGAVLRPWVRFPGQTSYAEGSASILVDGDGAFTWQRRTGKRIYVSIRSDDGVVKSNRLVIRR